MTLPFENFVGDSSGEDFLYDLFRKVLPKDYVSFHGYDLQMQHTDIIMLIPALGVLIIENKSIKAKNIAAVPDNTYICRLTKPAIFSPLKQAQKFCFQLIDTILAPKGIDSVYVLPSVSYPYINEQEFAEKGLDKISDRNITFLSEDLRNETTVLNRIKAIFDLAYSQINKTSLHKFGFHKDLLDSVGNLISPHFRNGAPTADPAANEDEEESESPAVQSLPAHKRDYSRLIVNDDGTLFTETFIAMLADEWLHGTKLFLYSSNNEAVKRIEDYFTQLVQDKKLPESFAISHGMSFRLAFDQLPVGASVNDFEIRNGEDYLSFDDQLVELDRHCSFNYGQYKMEHAPEENVIVTAGAGTGKTFSMVSRISYLLWKDEVDPDAFKQYLVMITFTNKSADEMKHRLMQNFLQLYELTRNSRHLEFLEAVEDVNISTIHSLCKKILERYSSRLGLGHNFRITTGSYRRKMLLRQNLNDSLKDSSNKAPSKMKMYFFEKKLGGLLDQFDNKNVDLVRYANGLDFGSGPDALPTYLLNVLTKTQQQLSDEMTKENAVYLGDLIRKIGQLLDRLSENDFPEWARVRYVFIDEFQDTDNVQIDLVKRFQRLIHFKYFVVGDIKQCIYRFRGAESAAFNVLKDGAVPEPLDLSLNKNYRTDHDLLEEMNHCFERWSGSGDLSYADKDILTGVIHKPLEHAWEFVECNNRQGFDEDAFVNVLTKAADDASGRDQKKISQVAILVRFNWQADQIVELCRKHGINVTTDIGGRLFQADPTIDLYKLLLALRYPNEPEYIYNLYTTCFVNESLPKQQLFDCSSEEIVQYFNDHCPIDHWTKYIAELGYSPVLQVLQEIVKQCKPWNHFANQAGPENRERYRKFYMRNLDQVFENLVHISNTDYLTINKLADYLEIMITTQQQANEREPFSGQGDENRIVCLTVHKAKGAEYDTVILPFNTFGIGNTIQKGDTDVIYVHPKVGYRIADHMDGSVKNKMAKTNAYVNNIYRDYQVNENVSRRREETRILYVAMTRAKYRLICFVPANRQKNDNTWASLLKED